MPKYGTVTRLQVMYISQNIMIQKGRFSIISRVNLNIIQLKGP